MGEYGSLRDSYNPTLSDNLKCQAADFGAANPIGSDYAPIQATSSRVPIGRIDDTMEHTGGPHTVKGAGSASKETPIYRRRSFLISLTIISLTGIGLLFVLLYPVVKAVAQHVMNTSTLNVDRVVISGPTNTSFSLHLDSWVSHAGIFSAQIDFTQALRVSWVNDSEEVSLGYFNLEPLHIQKKRAYINQTTDFTITNQGTFAQFTRYMVMSKNFTWRLRSDGLHVQVMKLPISKGISLNKDLIFSGINNFGDIVLKDFQLPSNSPEGGIDFYSVTTLINPSPFQLSLGTVVFNLFYDDIYLGTGIGINTTLGPGSNDIALSGRLVPHNSSESELAVLGHLFTQYINYDTLPVVARAASILQNGNTSVTWLSEGFQALTLHVLCKNPTPRDLIQSISISTLSFKFSEDEPWAPVVNSRNIQALMQLPFGFDMDIKALEQNISVSSGGAPFAELVVPKGAITTDVQQRIIYITFSNMSFIVFGDQHSAFQQFLASTTISTMQSVTLSGKANADADTPIGLVSLEGIEFSANTSIAGLQGLISRPPLVISLDVNRGFPDYLLIKVNSTLYNPSNITLGAGDVQFDLSFQDQQIGRAVVTNLLLLPGDESYLIDVYFQPQPDVVTVGRVLLEHYLQGVTSDIAIQGSQDSTMIDSLKAAMSAIRLTPVEIPALQRNLISSAHVELPTDVVQTGMACASFTLDNPFTAGISVFEISSTVTYQQLIIGTIDRLDLSSSPVHADGHSSITSQLLPFKPNLEPFTLVQVLLAGAQNNHVDLGPLVELFDIVVQNPSYYPPITATVGMDAPSCISGKQYSVADAILESLKNLMVTLDIESQVKVDDYPIELSFKQYNVTVITDKSALYLIGAVAPPIVQTLVDNANVTFNAAYITNLTDGGFDLALYGSLTNIGPLNALIEFVDPVTVTWQGNDIATIIIPPICAAANVGVPDYHTNAHLTIIDEHQFIGFATFLLHNASFTWTIHTNNLRVIALGTIFDGVSLSKDITLKAFNGLPSITISDFQLPSDDPAGGIHIEADSIITSPSQVGIDLGTVVFHASFEGTVIGPLSCVSMVLAPESEIKAHLSGRITPKSSTELIAIGRLFSEFLVGHNQNLIIQGDLVQPSGNVAVGWLSSAFKTLELQVILPGQTYEIVESITIYDLEVMMTEKDEAFAPLASSRRIVARYKNPFGFSLQVFQASEDIILGAGGEDAIDLKLPLSNTVGGVSTGDIADLEISFSKEPLQPLNNVLFSTFLAVVTDTQDIKFQLKGFADVVARTAIGEIPISNVPLNVTSSLKGINSFGNTARLEDLRIIGSGTVAGNQYINVDLTAVLHNPSNISLQTNDISLAVFYGDVKIGRAAINILNLVPGMNTIPTEFHFQPDHVNDTAVQRFLSEFTQSCDALALSIKGDPSSTPYASLVAALETISLTTSLTGLNVPPIITQINVYIPFSVIFDNLVFVDFDISNPLDTEIHVMFVQADARVNGETYAHFGQRFSNFAIPAKGTANSGKFGNVVLTNGTLRALAIIPSARLDVFCATTIMIGDDGYTIPWLRLTQPNVPTTYDLAGLSPDDLKRAFTNLMGKSPAAVDVARHIGSRDGSVSSVQATNARGRVASDRLPMRQTSIVRAD